MLPERLRIVEDWRLVYSLEQDGASLVTLQKVQTLRRPLSWLCSRCQGSGGWNLRRLSFRVSTPFSLILWQRRVFLMARLHRRLPATLPICRCDTPRALHDPNTHSADDGTWSPGNESIRFKAFQYSGLNDYYINCETGFLSVGSGIGHHGLWLDDSLDVGHSSRCDTFGNELLSDAGEKFSVLGVELWVLGA